MTKSSCIVTALVKGSLIFFLHGEYLAGKEASISVCPVNLMNVNPNCITHAEDLCNCIHQDTMDYARVRRRRAVCRDFLVSPLEARVL